MVGYLHTAETAETENWRNPIDSLIPGSLSFACLLIAGFDLRNHRRPAPLPPHRNLRLLFDPFQSYLWLLARYLATVLDVTVVIVVTVPAR